MANEDSNGTPDWIYDIIPANQIEEMEISAETVERNLKNGVNIVLSASNDSAIKLCRSYARGKNGDIKHWMHIVQFMDSFIAAVEQHLVEEDINPYE
ncbi:hypothetical protein UFOVP1335_48 [uncultured Caudovirales phage]|uniref:Uncharacterized protein n=1 Tax=uncultured Caudovirales phage TaxID=2100421 RepID=A0A6J5PIB5_9CAUD|nr:hypothetical protein UFOVP914_14 [uncultured Caudovirales phage]CAB4183370.1 hypothetical protein UFOVP1091_53 [uncultured Caudovirales phage]CAB4199473.1 hypothetical protein UFOVP1335_48 [uncultured Caudovirales phage]CAB4213026.1 hypothetical protein UFOVP1445_53 [uncultured Caudovirales phage]